MFHARQSMTERKAGTWWRVHNDTFAAVLLAYAALATAWSSYQASRWGGIQATQYNRSSELQLRSTHAADDDVRARLLDIALFSRWLEKYVEGRPVLAQLYAAHFRPEFRPAFQAWRALDSVQMVSTTPFDRPEYRQVESMAAEKYDRQAAAALRAGQRANELSDRYVFVTVILSLVIFFAGAIRPLVSAPLRGPMLLLASLLALWATIRIVTSPLGR